MSAGDRRGSGTGFGASTATGSAPASTPRALGVVKQGVLVLRWFVDGTRLAQLARDNEISVPPAYRYLHEGLTGLADHAPDLSTALEWAVAALHRRCLDAGSLRERHDAAAMRVAEPGWE